MAKGVASLAPESFASGGMFDDQDIRVVTARFEEFDYQGHADEPVCAIAVTMVATDDEDGDERVQYYSIGPLAKFTPSADRKSAVPSKEGTGINKSTNGALFLANLVTAGFPVDRLTAGDLSVMDGCVLHVNQMAAPKRSGGKAGIVQKEGATILLPTKVVALPEETARKSSKRAGKAQVAAGAPESASKASTASVTNGSGAPAAGAEDPSDTATGIVLGILASKPSLSKTALSQAAFQAGARGGVMALIAKTDWLADGDRPWGFKDGLVSAEK